MFTALPASNTTPLSTGAYFEDASRIGAGQQALA